MSEGKWGFIDKTGKFVIEPKFDSATVFYDGRARVGISGHSFLIDKRGIKAEPNNEFVWQTCFHNGLEPSYHGYKDWDGNIVIKSKDDVWWTDVSLFSNGLGAVQIENKKWGYVDKNGNMVIAPIFEKADLFCDGTAVVNYCGKNCFIDKNGNVLTVPSFDRVVSRRFIDGASIIETHGKQGLIDGSGKYLIQPKFDSVSFFKEGFAFVKTNGKYGFVDTTGNLIIQPKYDGVLGGFENGFACVKIDNKWGIVDMNGTFIISPSFEELRICGSIFFAKVGDKWGTIDKTGNFIIEPIIESYDWITYSDWYFSCNKGKLDNLISVEVNNKYGFVDKTGRIVIDPQFENAGPFIEGLAPVMVKVKNYATTIPTSTPTSSEHTERKTSNGGCYVATSVYGSYNCPEVWTLRRFRDNTLDATWYGRAFIQAYYAISPTLVKWFGETSWFKKLWRRPLDKLVSSLKNKGVEDTPYNDKY